MLKNSEVISAKIMRKNTFWGTQNLIPDLRDATERLAYLLANGYTIYDVTAEGGFANLSTKTAGKYVCLWVTGNPTGDYNFSASYLTGSGAVAHTAIEIMGVRITSNVLTGYRLAVNLKFATGTFSTLNLSNIDVTLKIQSGSNMTLTDIGIFDAWVTNSATGTTTILYASRTPNMRNVRFISTTSHAIFTRVTAVLAENCFFQGGTSKIGAGALATATLKNTVIAGPGSQTIDGEGAAGSRGYVNFDNVLLMDEYGGAVGYGSNLIGSNGVVSYAYRSGPSGTYPFRTMLGYIEIPYGVNIYGNYLGILPEALTKIIDGKNRLDYTKLTTDFQDITCKVTQIMRTYKSIKREYYKIEFDPNAILYDDFKVFDYRNLIVINRPDLYAIFADGAADSGTIGGRDPIGKTDENCIIIADLAGEKHYFGYIAGKLRGTIFSDSLLTASYSLQAVVNIMEIPDEVEYRNLMDVTDSPIEGSLLMQDITSKVVL